MWQLTTRFALKSSEFAPIFSLRTKVCGTERKKVVAPQWKNQAALIKKARIKKIQKSWNFKLHIHKSIAGLTRPLWYRFLHIGFWTASAWDSKLLKMFGICPLFFDVYHTRWYNYKKSCCGSKEKWLYPYKISVENKLS